MTNVAKKLMSKESKLAIAHNALKARKFHVESVEFGAGVLIADAVNEADPADEYTERVINLPSIIDFIELKGLNAGMFDTTDNEGEHVAIYTEIPAMIWLGENKIEAVTEYLNAGKLC